MFETPFNPSAPCDSNTFRLSFYTFLASDISAEVHGPAQKNVQSCRCVCECFAGQEAQQAGPVLKARRSSIIKSGRLSGTWIMAN